MSELLYLDLFIHNRDFVLNQGNEPVLCHNSKSIGQDIVHAILESGLATELIAERSPTLRGDILTRLEMLIESDERIEPGTVVITDESLTRLWVTAGTWEFGAISARLEL